MFNHDLIASFSGLRIILKNIAGDVFLLNYSRVFFPLFFCLLLGCACSSPLEPSVNLAPPAPSVQEPKKQSTSNGVHLIEPTDADRIQALRLVNQADKAYATGNYIQAERLLKRAISLYPFISRANLLLGKIFLIQGSARRDYTLLKSARLMFEMARALEPEMVETKTLMELFGARSIE